MAILGEMALWLALLMAGWTAIVSAGGVALRRADLAASGARALAATGLLLAVAAGVLVGALLDSDFTLRLVATSSTANLPPGYRIAALWTNAPGVMLAGVLAAAALGGTRVLRVPAGDERRSALVATTLGILIVGIIAAAGLPGAAFATLDFPVADGSGLPAHLQHPMLFVHPPLVLLAVAAEAVAFADLLAIRTEPAPERRRMTRVRRWLAAGWALLGAAIVSGAWWAERGPPPGGFAPGDAAEVLAVAAWIASGLALHGLAFLERRGRDASWPWWLAMLGLPLLLGGGAATRAGLAGSAHPSGQGRGAIALLVFAAAGIAASAIVHARRPYGVRLVPPAPHASSGWRAAGIVHLGALVVLVIAAAAGTWMRPAAWRATIAAGDSVQVRDAFGGSWAVTNQGVSHYDQDNRSVTTVAAELRPPHGAPLLVPTEIREYLDSRGAPIGKPVSPPTVLARPFQDVRLTFDATTPEERVTLRVRFLPLLSVVWVAAVVALVSGLVFLWPEREIGS